MIYKWYSLRIEWCPHRLLRKLKKVLKDNEKPWYYFLEKKLKTMRRHPNRDRFYQAGVNYKRPAYKKHPDYIYINSDRFKWIIDFYKAYDLRQGSVKQIDKWFDIIKLLEYNFSKEYLPR